MNNASLVYCAELARWHLSGTNGLLDQVLRQGWLFMVGSQHFLYRAPVPPFAPYEIHTVVDAIDDKWLYMRHTFLRPAKGDKPAKVYAEGTVKAIIVKRGGGKISPKEVIESLGVPPSVLSEIAQREAVDRCETFAALDEYLHQDARALVNGEESRQARAAGRNSGTGAADARP